MAQDQQEEGGGGTSDEERQFRAAGAEPLPDGRRGLRIKGWMIESRNVSILGSIAREQWEQRLGTSHLPEMVFGDSSLSLLHESSGIKIHFNAFDALSAWKKDPLPPIEVPAAKIWKFRSKPFQQVTLDYDYTFTTPYCGSEIVESHTERISEGECCHLTWEDCAQQIDLESPALREPILFYDEVVLYEDELSDNGISLLTVKVRVMPSCWFLLLRFWLRVDGVMMRLRDTRMFCAFGSDQSSKPLVLRDSCWREGTVQSLSMNSFPPGAYNDPNQIYQKLPVSSHETKMLQ